ncbi:M20 family metallopeptidase [Pseudarthrobacter sp. J75]|uniref:M20 family metallopeptidase n=1 Tax=unclassified Pseudarthrobacter TaxID=2647000 RepID=UPI002E804EBE|nr:MULTISPECIES: M20 family metallopeptidase [unclassified Pseudarthrobacter]MEE2523290.1 M20 family metallopeptidase [Pseudarthrobacter sp. J47]MEE2527545.1 M20 family metallopeptidase [Pseudarthrobacter sp. J75]
MSGASGPAAGSAPASLSLEQELEQEVLGLISESALVSLTTDLVAAAGENPGGTEEATVAVLRDFCLRAGLEVSTQDVAPGRPNFTAVLPGGDRPGLLFLGHSDVVPAGPGWDLPPFEPYVRDGRLYGRGSTDMKGGLAAVVIALAALKEAGAGLPGNMALACTVDEEDLGLGIRAFTPAALADPGFSYSACVVAEPTDLETVIGCRGDSYIELKVTGKAAHSGRPADGRNAIDAAAKILALVREDHARLQETLDPLLGAGSWNIGLINGGSGTSMVAAECTVSLDRRLMPGEDAAAILDRLLAKVSEAGIDTDGISVEAAVTMEMPGFRTPAEHPLVVNSVAALADAGVESAVTGWTAACDGGFISRDLGIPTIVMGPGGLNDQAHQVDESVSVAELVAASRAYALMCLRHGT